MSCKDVWQHWQAGDISARAVHGTTTTVPGVGETRSGGEGEPMKVTKAWCETMANLENGSDISAGSLSALPAGGGETPQDLALIASPAAPELERAKAALWSVVGAGIGEPDYADISVGYLAEKAAQHITELRSEAAPPAAQDGLIEELEAYADALRKPWGFGNWEQVRILFDRAVAQSRRRGRG